MKPSAEHAVPEPVLLIIADISGYTRYMTANAKTLSHSQVIITELVEAIIREVQLPLEVAKLEGDAVFLSCRKATPNWNEARRLIGEKLLTFFRMFSAKVNELSASTTCTCNACTHIEKLRLKIVVHSGEALFHRVSNFTELAGLDVIIVHRLLKNAVKSDQYLLLTETAHADLGFPATLPLSQSSESYDDIGRINTLVYLPESAVAPAVDAEFPAESDSFRTRFSRSWALYRRMWFAPLKSSPQQPAAPFRNLNTDSGTAARNSFALLTLLLTPLMLPVGALFVARHARRPAAMSVSAAHPAGCACGHHHT